MAFGNFFILEQPQEHGHRFRYATEKRDGGNLHGENGQFGHKSYPKLKLTDDITKSDRHYVLISCVDAEPCGFDKNELPKYRLHPCTITGRHAKNGVCKIFFDKNQSLATLDHIGIQMADKNSINASIKKKMDLGLDFYKVGKTSTPFDMKKLRLSFQVHVWNATLKKHQVLPPKVSNVILDQRCYNPLIIKKTTPNLAPFDGDVEVIILTESKINKTDTSIVFETEEGLPMMDFHLEKPEFYGTQALMFRSPKINPMQDCKSLNAKLFLRRQNKDGSCEESNKIDFQFYDNNTKKRQESGYNSDVEDLPSLQDTLNIIEAPPSSIIREVMDLDKLNVLLGDPNLTTAALEASEPEEVQGQNNQVLETPNAKRKHESAAAISARSIAIPSKKAANNDSAEDEPGPSFAEMALAEPDLLKIVMDDSGIFKEQEIHIQSQPTEAQAEAQEQVQGQNVQVIMDAPSSGIEFQTLDLTMLLSTSNIGS